MERWPFREEPSPGALRGDREPEIQEELELHLELRTEELVAQGMDRDAARREALARFGDPEEVARRVRRASRDRRAEGWTMMRQFVEDVRYAVRGFRLHPGFAVVSVLTLAVALAGNTAIFSVLDAAVLRALPFPDAERLVFVNGYHLQNGERAVRMASVPEFRDWQARARSIDPMVGVEASAVTVGGSGEGGAERAVAEFVSEGYFDLLGANPVLGRAFSAEEYGTPDGAPVVLLGHDLWTRRFGGDPSVVGRTLEVNDRSAMVVGVLPPGFTGAGLAADLWAPLAQIGLVASAAILEARGTRFLGVVGRLVPGATPESAERELDGIAGELQAMHPDLHQDRFAEVLGFREGYLGDTGRLLWILFGAGALLLAVAAANVANLLLVRAHGRSRELVVRRALGARTERMVRQLLTESVALAAAGGVLGLGLAWGGLRFLSAWVPDGVLPAYAEPSLSPRVFFFTLLVLAVVGLLAGLAPALSTARRDLAAALRSGGRGSGGGRLRPQRFFVVTQVGLALLLLVAAGLLGRSFRAQLAVDPGLEMEGIHSFALVLPRERYPDGASLRQVADDLVRRVGAVPGVSGAAVSSDFPFRGGSSGSYVAREDDPENLIRYHRHSVGPGYFQNLGVVLRAGRYLQESDDENAAGAVVVTQAFVDRVFPEAGSGVGQRFWVGPPGNPDNLAEIVGVVENVRYRDLTGDLMAEANSPDVFFAYRQVPSRSLVVSFRLDGPLSAAAPPLRQAVSAVDPSVAIYGLASLEELYRNQTATPRFSALLMGLLSALALTLACVGIYGVLAFAVSQRTREIAVRRALGAPAGSVARAVVWDGVRLAGLGLLLGGGAAWLGSGLLGRFLFEVEPTDPLTFGAVGGVLLLVALLAAAVPAVRAARKTPLEALGAE